MKTTKLGRHCEKLAIVSFTDKDPQGVYNDVLTCSLLESNEMAELTTWVSDKLHDVLGFSDKYTVEYLIGLAKSATSPDSLVQRVSEGFSVDNKMASFASELWEKLPHKSQPVEHPYRARERLLVEQREKYMKYTLVSDDDDDEEMLKKAKESKKDRKRKHLRRKTESSSSDEETSIGNTGSKEKSDESDVDEWEKEEEERKIDLEERDAFADRLKKRDKEKTRNILERSDKKVLIQWNFY